MKTNNIFPRVCDICTFLAQDAKEYDAHMKSAHPPEPKKEEFDYGSAWPVDCHLCGTLLRTEREYTVHNAKVHSIFAYGFPHACPTCNLEITNKFQQAKHNSTPCKPPGPKPILTCEHCDYSTIDKVELNEHRKLEHPKELPPDTYPRTCEICGFVGEYRQKYYWHMKHKHGVVATKPVKPDRKTKPKTCRYPRKCPHCDFKAKYKMEYWRHVHSHENDNPYEKHMDLKLYPRTCSTCGIVCENHNDYIIHQQQVHNNFLRKTTYPLKCHKCSYMAIDELDMKIHVNRDHSKQSCGMCDHEVIGEYELASHIKDAHPYKCDECDFNGTDTASLESHKSKNHPAKCDRGCGAPAKFTAITGKKYCSHVKWHCVLNKLVNGKSTF